MRGKGSRPWGLWTGSHLDLIHNFLPTRVAPSFRKKSPSSNVVHSRRTLGLQGRLLCSRVLAFLFSFTLAYNKLLYAERRDLLRARTTCQTPRLNPRFELRSSRNIHDTFAAGPRRTQRNYLVSEVGLGREERAPMRRRVREFSVTWEASRVLMVSTFVPRLIVLHDTASRDVLQQGHSSSYINHNIK